MVGEDIRVSLDGRVAVVTGAANGIGRACALALAANGATVAMLDIEGEPLARVAEEARAAGGRAIDLVCDVTDYPRVVATFERISRECGPVDILLNNAGQSARERASEFWCSEPDTWRFVVELNLMAVLSCTRQVVPSMRERRSGRVINIASEAPIAGLAGVADYSAAKGGVIGFTRTLARELAPFQVTVNAVCPGPIATRGGDRIPQEVLDQLVQDIPIGFNGAPSDIANAVVYLASPGSRYVTGQSLLVNGGRWWV